VAYRLKYVSRGRGKHRIMAGMEFMARLAALVCPPRYPLLRYAGVLAPRSAWRKDVVPKPREHRPACNGAAGETSGVKRHAEPKPGDASPRRPERPKEGARPALSTDGGAAVMRPTAMQLPPDVPLMQHTPDVLDVVARARPGDVIALTPNVLSVKHWDRLFGGVLYAATPRVDWSALLRRSFQVDVMECAKCGGRLRVLAVITEREPVRRILGHLGLPPDAPPLARARDPTDDDVEPSGQLELGLA
jgi:Putative transposase